jgi:DNA repair exonuclease SbcCD ATPase subunit
MNEKLEELQSKLSEWQDELQRQAGVRDSLTSRMDVLVGQEERLYDQANVASEALGFVENSVQSIRGKTFRSIEAVTNESLQSVYSDNLKIECDFSIKRNRSAVEIRIVKEFSDGTKLKRSPEGSGCGVSDVVSLCLRMVLIRATGCIPILIADEPFKWLGRDQIPQAAKLLKFLSEKLNMQIIVTSHHPIMRELADKSFWLELNEEEETKIISVEGE